MTKRFISVTLLVVLIFTLTACSQSAKASNNGVGVVSPSNSGEKPEITILYYKSDSFLLKEGIFPRYIRDFEKQYGVEVTLQGIGDGSGSQNDIDNFQKKLSTYLHGTKGPELIMLSSLGRDMIQLMMKEKVAVNLRDKVANINKIYEGLLDDEVYYAPIGMDYSNDIFKKKVLEELGITDLGTEWTTADYNQLFEKWMRYAPRSFTANDFYYIYYKYMQKCRLYEDQSKKALLDTPAVKAAIQNIRKDIYENYKLNKSYTYENYYNMIFETTSEEAQKGNEIYDSKEYREQSLRVYGYGNIRSRLFARQIQEALNIGAVLCPEYKDRGIYITSFGFLVNKNGSNVELAYEFINGLLSDEIQMGLWQPSILYQYYPVNKDIEEQIIKAEIEEGANPEAMEAKMAALNLIKENQAQLIVLNDFDNNSEQIGSKIFGLLQKEIVKFIFADTPYSDEELSAELKRLEAEYTIWMNE